MTRERAVTLFLPDDVLEDVVFVLSRDEEGRPQVVVEIDNFVAKFADVPFAYQDLVDADDGQGYKPIFDSAKERGVFS